LTEGAELQPFLLPILSVIRPETTNPARRRPFSCGLRAETLWTRRLTAPKRCIIRDGGCEVNRRQCVFLLCSPFDRRRPCQKVGFSACSFQENRV
jgi:hypothetical protein